MIGSSESLESDVAANGLRLAAESADDVPEDWPNRSSSRMVDAGGIRWHVQQSGSGPCMLLMHGTAASTHSWRDLMPLLAARYNVVAMDLPGHGFTSRPRGFALSLPAVSNAIVSLCRRLELSPACIAGHSAGAAVALRMALDRALEPTHIVGLNAALLPFGGGLQKLLAPMAKLFASTELMPRLVARRALDIAAVRRVLEGTGSRIDDEGVRLYQRLLQREQHVAAVLSMMANWELGPLLDDLPALDARLCLVAGGRDRAVSAREAERVAAAMPGTRVERLDDCGHLAHEEQPQRVARLIDAFCSPTGTAADA